MTFKKGGHCGAFVDDKAFHGKRFVILFRSLKMRLDSENIPAVQASAMTKSKTRKSSGHVVIAARSKRQSHSSKAGLQVSI
jgi:hypothetical protein